MQYLGTITGSSGSCSNAWTGPSGIAAPFAIPPGARRLWLQPSASGVKFEIASATGISFQTTAARAAQLAGPNVMNGPFPLGRTDWPSVVAVYNDAGGNVSVRVYADANP